MTVFGSDPSGDYGDSRWEEHGPVQGIVVKWRAEKGWGVLESPALEGRVWAHFSAIEGPGFRDLTRGQPVEFKFQTPGQDSYEHRATWVRALLDDPAHGGG